MKETYFEKLTELFLENNFDEKTYLQIVEKYQAWYDKLLMEGKSDEEIQTLLKSPEEVVEVFANKFKQQEVIVESKEEVVEEYIETESTTTPIVEETVSSSNQTIDPSLITKTSPTGKTMFYRKRSFGGALGMFFVFFLVSLVAISFLGTLFSVFLSVSWFSLVLFFAPMMYLGFVFNFDSVAYLQPGETVVANTADKILIMPYEFFNEVIEQLNSITTFDWSVFFQTILVSLFAFALLLLSLFFTYQIFKLFINYFSFFFNKITLKRVKI